MIPTLVSSFPVKKIHRLNGIRRHDYLFASSSSSLIKDLGSRLRTTQLDDQKPRWLSDAMENVGAEETDQARALPKLASGLSGFCLDAELGFVAILTAPSDDAETLGYVPVTVVHKSAGLSEAGPPGTRSRLTSPQALTLVQLAGGLDLGTPVLPPDALWQTIVREGIDGADKNGDDDDDLDGSRDSPLITLLGIEVVPNEEYDADQRARTRSDSSTPVKATEWTKDWMDDDSRNEVIQQRAPQVSNAVSGLPGLQAVTLEQVQDTMLYCANREGGLDREGFSHLLDYLRRSVGFATTNSEGVNWKSDSKVMFVLSFNLVEQDSIKTLSVTTSDAFRAIGLSMRHKIQLQVAPECLGEDTTSSSSSLLERFPDFRSIQELWEDAKVMDGFIPSMFEQSQQQRQNGPPPSQTE